MSMIDHSVKGRNIPSLNLFSSLLHIAKTLARCGAVKRCGVAPMRIFSVLLQTAFIGRSLYMQMKTGSFKETFSKNTI